MGVLRQRVADALAALSPALLGPPPTDAAAEAAAAAAAHPVLVSQQLYDLTAALWEKEGTVSRLE
jgi:hypothetical protein